MSTDLTPTAAADGGHLVSFIDDKNTNSRTSRLIA
jgi:hypothetical protein